MRTIKMYSACAVTVLLLAAAVCWFPLQASFAKPSEKRSEKPSATVAVVSVEPTSLAAAKSANNAVPVVVDSADDQVQQKYAILFSALQLSPQTRVQLQQLLREREAIAGRRFYDVGNNSAEIAENLRQRELALATMDERIAQLLTSDDAKKYALLKDSTYEQALLNGFYQVAGMDAVPEPQKLNLLLNKLEQKQKIAELAAAANEQIANAAPATKPFLIEQTRKAFVAGQEDYLRMAKIGLSDEQFELLRQYEQLQSDERWQDLLSSWQ